MSSRRRRIGQIVNRALMTVLLAEILLLILLGRSAAESQSQEEKTAADTPSVPPGVTETPVVVLASPPKDKLETAHRPERSAAQRDPTREGAIEEQVEFETVAADRINAAEAAAPVHLRLVDLADPELDRVARRISTGDSGWPALSAPFDAERAQQALTLAGGWLVVFGGDPHLTREVAGGFAPHALRALPLDAPEVQVIFPIADPPEQLQAFVAARWTSGGEEPLVGWLVPAALAGRLLALLDVVLRAAREPPERVTRISGRWSETSSGFRYVPEVITLNGGVRRTVRIEEPNIP